MKCSLYVETAAYKNVLIVLDRMNNEPLSNVSDKKCIIIIVIASWNEMTSYTLSALKNTNTQICERIE